MIMERNPVLLNFSDNCEEYNPEAFNGIPMYGKEK